MSPGSHAIETNDIFLHWKIDRQTYHGRFSWGNSHWLSIESSATYKYAMRPTAAFVRQVPFLVTVANFRAQVHHFSLKQNSCGRILAMTVYQSNSSNEPTRLHDCAYYTWVKHGDPTHNETSPGLERLRLVTCDSSSSEAARNPQSEARVKSKRTNARYENSFSPAATQIVTVVLGPLRPGPTPRVPDSGPAPRTGQ